ncbi:MAG: DUF5076 domain-containing protein [Planctomycetia bacterium]|nr:DUF5076 domain-containing protein [Planctomycetia bacterium]
MAHDHVHDENCNHGDDEGVDLIRLTLVGEHMHCSLDPTIFEDEPSTWGTVLADLARNLSQAMRDDPLAQRELLADIREKFIEAIDTLPDDDEEG